MASSPPPAHTQSPTALSPPATQLPLTTANLKPVPKKRPSLAGDAQPAKKRKASSLSVTSIPLSAHPLRQTSFPPEDFGAAAMRSPSVDFDTASIVSGSQVSAVGSGISAPVKKKRGRKSKAEKARETAEQQDRAGAGSAGGSATGGGADGRSAVGAANRDGDQPDEEDDDNDVVQMSITSARNTEAQMAEEKKLRAMLARCMDSDQFERYSNWRAAKLPDPIVRRIVNTTVSQSVAQQIIGAVRTVAKYYLCDIIRIAREVQAEWIAAGNEPQAAEPIEDHLGGFSLGPEIPWPGKVMSAEEEAKELAAASQSDTATVTNSFTDGASGTLPSASFASRNEELDRQSREVILREPPRGPLRPDHLREALRRYNASGQSQGIGSLRIWQEQQRNGAERFPAKTGGRRIFR